MKIIRIFIIAIVLSLMSFIYKPNGIILQVHKFNDLGTEYIYHDTVFTFYETNNNYKLSKKFYTTTFDKNFFHIEVIDTIIKADTLKIDTIK